MGREAFELAILISLKDAASAGSDRVADRLRALGKEGKATLQTFEDLRKNFQRGLVIGSVGVAGLRMLKDGAKTAGDFESALTELRLSVEEVGKSGAVNLGQLNDQMNRFEHLATNLGNRLPGTTQDFLEMFVALKQGGLQTETILKGAGEQVAYLSVLTHSSPKELAQSYAEIGEMFQLKPEEYASSVEDFIKNYRAVGLRPEDLVEGAKFAQLRGGLPLGLEGLSGLESMSTLLGVLKMSGLKGGVGGRESAALLLSLVPASKDQKKIDAQLRKAGVDMKFFDRKGQFLGIENLIKQLEKLRKLSPEKSEELIKKRFGETALGPISALSKTGAEGLAKYQARAQSVASVQAQLNELTDTYNQKVEALEGTLDNLKATVFTPMLDSLKPLIDDVNNAVGAMQGFSKANPTLTKTITDLALIGSTAALLGGAFMSLRAKYYMWKIAIAVGSGEKGLLDFLGNTRKGVDDAAKGLERSAPAFNQAGRKLGSALVAGIGLAAADWYINKLFDEKSNIEGARAQAFAAGQQLGDMILDGLRQEIETKMDDGALGKFRKLKAEKEADERLKSIGADNTTSDSDFNRHLALTIGDSYFHEHGYLRWWDTVARSVMPSRGYPTKPESEDWITTKLQSASFAYPEQLIAMLQKAKSTYQQAGQPEMYTQLKGYAEQVYPQWKQQIEASDDAMGEFKTKTTEANGSLSIFSTNLRNFQVPLPTIGGTFGNYQPRPLLQPQKKGGIHFEVIDPQFKADGGDVLREGLVYVHPDERILKAADVTRGYKGSGGAGGASPVVIHNLHIHPPKGSRMAENPEAFGGEVTGAVTRRVLRQRERR